MDIRIDTLDSQEEKQFLLELSYDGVLNLSFEKTSMDANSLYTLIVSLTGLTIQRFYENTLDTGPENWLLISVNRLNADYDSYKIQWSSGYYYCLANHNN